MSGSGSSFRVGVDVGGTFTDLVALDATGALRRIKVPSTPRAPEEGVMNALDTLLRELAPGDVALLSHSSTVATNALLGQMNLDLPRTLLLTTEGFRDVLEIGRQNRAEVYNLFVRRPQPLVERRHRIGVRERMDPFGTVVVPLDPQSLEAALQAIERSAAGAVAVAYLHAYANDAHERATKAAIASRFPEVHVSLSTEVNPEYREYERTSTTVVNAMLEPLVRKYLERLASGVTERKIAAPLYMMQSNGGMASLETVAERPARTIESGPASGVIGAAFLGRELGIENVLSFDMGGTTAKAGTIVGGRVQVANEFEAAGKTHSGRAVKGSGYPVRFPFVDLAEVSAGGGTIAYVDAGGALRVGPLSAGADPGPAAYGRGTQPTVTDANIVLGRLNPRALLGGAMPIDAKRSRAALESLLPELPELDLDRLAAGVVKLVDTEMAKILRIVTVERGYDPRRFTLMAFGGGGPLHACALAEDLSIPEIIVPLDPGLFSAFGLLVADVRTTSVRSIVAVADGLDPSTVESVFTGLEAAGAADLRRQGVAAEATAFVRELDMRYLGQSFELTIAADAPYDAAAAGAALQRFHARHREAYGYASHGEPVEIVAARSAAVGTVDKPALVGRGEARVARGAPEDAVLERRDVLFEDRRVATRVFARERLRAGDRIAGPAIVEQYDSCTLVAPAWTAAVDDCGNLRMTR